MGWLADLNRRHLQGRESDPSLAACMKSMETAYGMQQEAPEVFDLSRETEATHQLYGLERGSSAGFAWQCLVARRLAERGVRLIELIDAGADINKNWDAPFDIQTHRKLAKNVDQPIAALLKDLKSRGMLDDTLVVWTTEFGRTPFREKAGGNGREHHNRCFSSWLAGGGVKPGITYGESDEYGIDVAKDMGLETPEEDMGQTLGHYGMKPGPYLVLPLLPPFTVRDFTGYVGDVFLNPINWLVAPLIEVKNVPSIIAHKNRTTTSVIQFGARVEEIVNERSRNLEKYQGVEEATLDLYTAVRNAYLQTRAKAVRE